MTRLDDALARFSAALDQLESRVGEANALALEAAGSPGEISLLRAERERMCARIGEMEEESRALAGLMISSHAICSVSNSVMVAPRPTAP